VIEKTMPSSTESTQRSFVEAAKAHGRSLNTQSQDRILQKNWACLDFHCDAFGLSGNVRDSRAFTGFTNILRISEHGSLEVSVKVEDGLAHAARFNIFCQPSDKGGFVSNVADFFDDVAAFEGVRLNTAPIRDILDAPLDWNSVSRVVCGIDLRAEPGLSRLKLWFFAEDEPDRPDNLVTRALTGHGASPLFDALHVHPTLLLGYDLRFDGTTALKLYPDIREDEFTSAEIQSRLASVLSPRAQEALAQSYWTHLYLSSRNTDTMLQVHPKEPDEFIDNWLPHPLAHGIHRTYAEIPLLDMVVSLPAMELDSKAIENFTLYYMPADLPQNFKLS
jgi:LynF/TruF/PatF family peptide O-prenyltransferase